MQHALDTVTRDSTNGDQFNIKMGTAELLAASLNFTTYGTPTLTAPCRFRGYTSAANDGGIGWLSGNSGAFQLYNAARSHVYFIDMEFSHGGHATSLVAGAGSNFFRNCYFHDYTGTGTVLIASTGFAIQCRIDNLGSANPTAGISINGDACNIDECYIKGNGAGFRGIRISSTSARVERNILSECGLHGVLSSFASTIRNNTIFTTTSATSARGIEQETVATGGCYISGNVIEGYNGGSSIGLLISRDVQLFGMNAVFNCTTAYTLNGDKHIDMGGDETLLATALAKSGSDTYANRLAYFAPLNVGGVWGGARFGFDKGALQHGALQPVILPNRRQLR